MAIKFSGGPNEHLYDLVTVCRICGHHQLEEVLDLGDQPPANAFYLVDDPIPANVPLVLMFCSRCAAVQLNVDVNPDYLFSNYLWVTGTSSTANVFSKKFVTWALKAANVKNTPFVVELASNDGTFLREFRANNCDVLGVDPAENICALANESGIPTICDFFNEATANEITQSYGYADVVVARNVIPHVKNLHSVIDGMKHLMEGSGVGVIEFHKSSMLLERLHYDYIYHEHLMYFSLATMSLLLKQHGLYPFDLRESPISGGSWVIYFSACERDVSERLLEGYESEKKAGVDQFTSWLGFATKVREHSMKLMTLVEGFNSKLIAYGASARSSTLLNWCGLDDKFISVVVDKNPFKKGRKCPGSGIPVVGINEQKHELVKSDVVLLLAWNFQEEITKELQDLGFSGKILLPLPDDPRLI